MQGEEAIHASIRSRAVDSPKAIALTCAEANMAWGELGRRASGLAGLLAARGVTRGQPVALSGDRSLDLVVGLLGILEAGAWYVPVDPSYPAERNAALLRDSAARVAVVTSGVTPPPGLDPVLIDAQTETSSSGADPVPLDGTDAAYGLYTSGSTGAPKCVVVEHASLAHYVSALGDALEIGPGDRYLHTASFAFSASVRQLLVPLARGASVVIATAAELRDPRALLATIRRERVTFFDTVPAYLRHCASIAAGLHPEERGLLAGSSLRCTMTTGEPMPREVARAWRELAPESARVVNLYGQTETTGSVALHVLGPADFEGSGSVPIGRPLAGTQFHALDDQGRAVAPGEVAELQVSGASLARGYLRLATGTPDRFLVSPTGERSYRTGDRVRVRADGVFEFVGRMDDQVKVNGVRIELGEVAAALRSLPATEDAAVLAREDDGRARLVAYVVAPTADVAELRRGLRAWLPDAMIPQEIVHVPRIPRLPNGKLDRTALAVLPAAAPPEEGAPDASGDSALVRALSRCWSEQLRLPSVAADADFFELGGDSLEAVGLVTRIQEQLPVELPLIAIFFDSPTVSAMAEALVEELSAEDVETLVRGLESASHPPDPASDP